MATFKEITENKRVNERHVFVRGNDNLTKYCAITGKQCEVEKIELILFTNMSRIRAFDKLSIKFSDLE